MKHTWKALFAIVASAGVSAAALADDVEGVIERIDTEAQSVDVAGVTYYADDNTDYDDDLERFEDLAAGQRVEIDFDARDGRNYIREIELED